jgi:hypothetical protein
MGAVVLLQVGGSAGAGDFSEALRDLMICVPLGAATYFAMLWLLWRLSDRPEAVEVIFARYVTGKARALFRM